MHDAELRNARDERVEDFRGAIGRAVVDRDDLEVRIIDRREHAERFLRLRLFVVAREEDGNGRIFGQPSGIFGRGSCRPRSQW